MRLPLLVGKLPGVGKNFKYKKQTAPPTHRYNHNMADNLPSRMVIAPIRSVLAHHVTVRAVQTTPPPNQTREPD